ncbi:MAG: CoA-acylating methylmalonate-semialdehyde dehydrogenase [Candidatus Sericytochromatia bacterium]|nr:CoA-acylating methylmalonate-semialdehyde dehydrogenase [Candidatus Sericytochromatia bacterium]
MTPATTTQVRTLGNYIDGKWVPSTSTEFLDVVNPATEEVLARVPLSNAQDLDAAVRAADRAFQGWRQTPPAERCKVLFKWKNLLEEHFEEIARICTMEHGKTLAEARGDLRRGIDNLDVAVGIPSLMQGEALEDVGRGIDCVSYRRPMGVFAIIAPFNFPPMVPMWFIPYAIATGNTIVLKPSEQVPLSQQRMWELLEQCGLPPGVVNLVNGGREIVTGMCEHPLIKGVSFVGSSPVAQYVYETATRHGKRAQALGGAKNFIVVMPDADLERSVDILVESCYGCAGQRCLAGATLVFVGDAYEKFKGPMLDRIRKIKIGNGLDEDVELGPVISKPSLHRIHGLIARAIEEGAEMLLDGRTTHGQDKGYFLGPTLFDKVTPDMEIAREEVFGPVMAWLKVDTLEQALAILDAHPYGNTTSIFTTSGKHARTFAYHAEPSMMGINVGVAAPMSYFNFGGAKGSMFGDLKAHGKHGIEFYTDRKVVITRWF